MWCEIVWYMVQYTCGMFVDMCKLWYEMCLVWCIYGGYMCVREIVCLFSHKSWTEKLADILGTVNGSAVNTSVRLVSSVVDSVPLGHTQEWDCWIR